MTCRDEIITCAKAIIDQQGVNEFSIADILEGMRRNGTQYADSTIRTHIVSKMCVNAPPNHDVRYADLERIDRGLYRFLSG